MIIQQQIETKLQAALAPLQLQVVNESYMHSVPANSETHFKLVIVSDLFSGKRKVARHQLVYGLLRDELSSGVHALAMHLYAPQEWSEHTAVAASPNCMGGSKSG